MDDTESYSMESSFENKNVGCSYNRKQSPLLIQKQDYTDAFKNFQAEGHTSSYLKNSQLLFKSFTDVRDGMATDPIMTASIHLMVAALATLTLPADGYYIST